MTVNERIKELMEARHWLPNYLADLIDLSSNSVYKWFREQNPTKPTVENIGKVCEVMEITPIQFLQGCNFPNLNAEQENALSSFSKLDTAEKKMIIALMDKLNTNKGFNKK